MPQDCLLAYISMKLKENLPTPSFLDQPPFSAFYPHSTEIFETPPFQSILGNSNPPLERGSLSYVCQLFTYLYFWKIMIWENSKILQLGGKTFWKASMLYFKTLQSFGCLTLPEKRDKGAISEILMRNLPQTMIFFSRNFLKRIFLATIELRNSWIWFEFKKYNFVSVRKCGIFR